MRLNSLWQIIILILNEHICQMYGEHRLPLIVQGAPPRKSNEINHDLPLRKKEGEVHDSEPRPIIQTIDVKSNLTERFDRTSIKCLVRNPSIRISHEIGFEIELPSHDYKVTNMTLGIHGDNSIYKATYNEDAEIIYNKLSERKQSVVIIKEFKKEDTSHKSYQEVIMLGMIASIPPGEILFITLEYEGPLLDNSGTQSAAYIKTWNHYVHINPYQLVQDFSVNIDIIETVPIHNVLALVVKDQWPDMDHSVNNVKYGNTSKTLHISFYPKESSKQDGGYDMNTNFYTKYTCDKNFFLRKAGQDITDIASVSEDIMLSTTLMHGVGFVFHMILLIPFVIMTEMISAFGMFVSVLLGDSGEWYLNQEPWYEREIEYEFEKFVKVLDQLDKLEIFEDAFNQLGDLFCHGDSCEPYKVMDHGDFDAAAFDAGFKPVPARKIVVPSPSSKPNLNHFKGNSIFVDYKKVLAETTPKKTPDSRFVIYEEPLVRKF